jgi:hypothetical protein
MNDDSRRESGEMENLISAQIMNLTREKRRMH